MTTSRHSEEALGGGRLQISVGHSSTATGRGILAFSREWRPASAPDAGTGVGSIRCDRGEGHWHTVHSGGAGSQAESPYAEFIRSPFSAPTLHPRARSALRGSAGSSRTVRLRFFRMNSALLGLPRNLEKSYGYKCEKRHNLCSLLISIVPWHSYKTLNRC